MKGMRNIEIINSELLVTKTNKEIKELSDNFIADFIKDLSNKLKGTSKNYYKNMENQELQTLENGTVYVVYGHYDEKMTVINPETGDEFQVYITTSNDITNKLNKKGIFSNIYSMEKNDFYNVSTGSKLKMNQGKLKIYNGKINIANTDAWYKLNDMFSSIKEEEGKKFVVKEIKDDKIYMTNENGGGYFYVYKQVYPNLNTGDIVKKNDGQYIKVQDLNNNIK